MPDERKAGLTLTERPFREVRVDAKCEKCCTLNCLSAIWDGEVRTLQCGVCNTRYPMPEGLDLYGNAFPYDRRIYLNPDGTDA